MHLCTQGMRRMLATALFIVCALFTTFITVAPANADTLQSLSALIAEAPKAPLAKQMRIDDDPTPLANLLQANAAEKDEKASQDSKLDAFADPNRSGDFYFAQAGSGKCTITSIAMMVKRAAFLDDAENWQSIGAASVTADGWTSAGAKNEFTTAGYAVSYISLDNDKQALIKMLEEHPEGIAAYDPGVPHAVLLTDYDADTDTFYCADPASYYSGKRIPVTSSWNGERRGSQASVIAGFTRAWIIKA